MFRVLVGKRAAQTDVYTARRYRVEQRLILEVRDKDMFLAIGERPNRLISCIHPSDAKNESCFSIMFSKTGCCWS